MQKQPELTIDLNKATDIVCKCGCKHFQPSYVLKKISALLSPSGKDTMSPIQVFACTECHRVPDEFLSAFTS